MAQIGGTRERGEPRTRDGRIAAEIGKAQAPKVADRDLGL